MILYSAVTTGAVDRGKGVFLFGHFLNCDLSERFVWTRYDTSNCFDLNRNSTPGLASASSHKFRLMKSCIHVRLQAGSQQIEIFHLTSCPSLCPFLCPPLPSPVQNQQPLNIDIAVSFHLLLP